MAIKIEVTNRALYGLLIIGIVSAAAGAGTIAFFTDTETSTNNTFTSGTIDIGVDEQNPWNDSVTIGDIKPSHIKWVNHTVTNEGNNTVRVYKHVNVTDQSDGLHPESENTEDPNGTINDISTVIDYGLHVRMPNGTVIRVPNGARMVQDLLTVDAVNATCVNLGTIEPGESIEVMQRYHMNHTAGNEYQGDTMTFTIEYTAQQLNAPSPGCACCPDFESFDVIENITNKSPHWKDGHDVNGDGVICYFNDTDNGEAYTDHPYGLQ